MEKQNRARFLLLTGVGLTTLIVASIVLSPEKDPILFLNKKSLPIHDALEKYYFDHDRYPDQLDALVPEYLDEIIEPGIFTMDWGYAVNGSESEFDSYVIYIFKDSSSESILPGWAYRKTHGKVTQHWQPLL